MGDGVSSLLFMASRSQFLSILSEGSRVGLCCLSGNCGGSLGLETVQEAAKCLWECWVSAGFHCLIDWLLVELMVLAHQTISSKNYPEILDYSYPDVCKESTFLWPYVHFLTTLLTNLLVWRVEWKGKTTLLKETSLLLQVHMLSGPDSGIPFVLSKDL